VSGSPGTSPWLSGSALSLPSKRGGNCGRAEPDGRSRLLRDRTAGAGKRGRLVPRVRRGRVDLSHGSGFGGAFCTPTMLPLCCLRTAVLSALTRARWASITLCWGHRMAPGARGRWRCCCISPGRARLVAAQPQAGRLLPSLREVRKRRGKGVPEAEYWAGR